MLSKGSAAEHWRTWRQPDGEERTAAEILRRKKDLAYRAIAEQLASGVSAP